MNINLISAILFYSIIFILIYFNRKKFDIHAKIIALYRTKIGIKFMRKLASSYPRLFQFLGFSGIIVGYIGMVYILYLLFKGLYILITVPDSPSMIAPVLPGIQIPNSPIFIPFWYGIISIFIVVVVHEFSHGIIASLHKLKIKSSGFGMFAIFPIAFVEPDEQQVNKLQPKKQLSIFAAGPFSNIILAVIILLITSLILVPQAISIIDSKGVKIVEVEKGSPAEIAGIGINDLILAINNQEITNISQFTETMNYVKPGDTINITTNKTTISLTTIADENNASKSHLGVFMTSAKTELKPKIKEKYGNYLPWSIFYVLELFQWIFILSLGIGLANLLPLGPVDGGRMLLTTLRKFFDEAHAQFYWKRISALTLILLILNFIYPYLRNLF